MSDPLSLAVSGASLIISGTTAWLTLLRKGTVRMTQPAIVCFVFEVEQEKVIPKVFLRTLLYCTAKRGIVVENMFIKLKCGKSSQTFSMWAYGDKGLVRGSGIYVGIEGVSNYHHFLLPSNAKNFAFLPGNYTLQVFASLVGSKQPLRLAEVNLTLTEEEASSLESREAGVWFDWEPSSKRYISESLSRPRKGSEDIPLRRFLFENDSRTRI